VQLPCSDCGLLYGLTAGIICIWKEGVVGEGLIRDQPQCVVIWMRSSEHDWVLDWLERSGLKIAKLFRVLQLDEFSSLSVGNL
jgi:hypothetical protein